MSILSEITKKIEGLQENIEKMLVSKTADFSSIVELTQNVMNQVGLNIITEALENEDERIRKSAFRLKSWNVQRRNENRTICTEMGPLVFSRTYYVNKRTGKYTYLLDEKIHLKKHQRIENNLIASLLSDASDMSYKKAVDHHSHSGITSKMTVHNLVVKYGDISNTDLEVKEKKEIDRIYVEADEDHVNYTDGKNHIEKVIYVHEGRKSVGKNRMQLKNIRYFVGNIKYANEELWRDVLSYIDDAYDLSKVKEVTVSGDGGTWIKEGVNQIPKSVYYQDKFHIQKYIKKASRFIDAELKTGHFFEDNLRKCIDDKDLERLQEYFREVFDLELKPSQEKAISDCQKYFINNWESICRTMSTGYEGCSAEGHVSHLLSDRLSSRPLTWSIEGADNISRIRAYKKNGGDLNEYITKIINKQSDNEKKEKIRYNKKIKGTENPMSKPLVSRKVFTNLRA